MHIYSPSSTSWMSIEMPGPPLVTLASFQSNSCAPMKALCACVRAHGIDGNVCFSFVLYEPMNISTWFLRHMDISTLDSSVYLRSADGWMDGWVAGWMDGVQLCPTQMDGFFYSLAAGK